MLKLRKAAVAAAVLASAGLLGAGTAYAGGVGGGHHNHPHPHRIVAAQHQVIRVEAPLQQWGGGHHRHKSHGHRIDIRQHTSCRSHQANVDVLGNVGILNGLLGNAGGGVGNPGVQSTRIGSVERCSNIIRK
ncbi:hypothetical protein AB0C96_36150 [Streptomyces sp. NPDC048506]|uniref:hypothetical protein n=1 Tax=Streptomyces sp. NPDC048506 TaxID=3155028 RepID=UPI00341D87EB